MMRSLRMAALLWTLAVLIAGWGAPTGAQAPAAPPATTVASDGNARAHPDWFKQCQDQVAAMQGKRVDMVFIGDSITQGWLGMPTPAWDEVGGTVWPKWYGSRHALDFGVGADKTQDVLWRLHTMDVKHFRPKVAVVLIGTNNTKDTPADIAAGVRAVVSKTRQTFPGVKVILMSILPNRRANALMAAANILIQPIADNKTVFYFDLASLMTPVGDNWKGIGKDHLHLSAEGYELWASAMEPLLDRLLRASRRMFQGRPRRFRISRFPTRGGGDEPGQGTDI